MAKVTNREKSQETTNYWASSDETERVDDMNKAKGGGRDVHRASGDQNQNKEYEK